ncbi:MAG: sulfite exporter TauE/SafE family protein, partial [Burkholderiaceae bacterium]|nr:sulfite exporter TauE/SafE family protein [Burkholderiaceae bacterium]
MPIELVIAAFGGFLCGFLNTVASSGSAVTLPLLVFMGLSPIVANATNRVPVVVAAFIATISFLRAKVIDWKIAI